MCSVAFSSCKRTSLFGYHQHFIIIMWSCPIVPKNSILVCNLIQKPIFWARKKKVTRHWFCYWNSISLLSTSPPILDVNNEHSGRIVSTCSSGWLLNLFGEQLYFVKAIGNKHVKQQQQQQGPRSFLYGLRCARSVLPRRRANIPP